MCKRTVVKYLEFSFLRKRSFLKMIIFYNYRYCFIQNAPNAAIIMYNVACIIYII
jgi:hypothetical protein